MSSAVSTLVNPLASIAQLEVSGSQLDGVPVDLENSIRYTTAKLTQATGVLLRLPQDVIAQAIVILTRFWLGPEGGSLRDHGALDIAAASMYLMTKLSAHPRSPRSIINVYAYLTSHPVSSRPHANGLVKNDFETSCYLTQSEYEARRSRMMTHEAIILRKLGYQTHVALPYAICINYLQMLEVFQHEQGRAVAARAVAHLNTALLSPQLLYATHQPNALATAAIYLAAREIGVKLPEDEWWEVLDTDREELGFLVAAMVTMAAFAAAEAEKWGKRRVPMTVDELDGELESRRILAGER